MILTAWPGIRGETVFNRTFAPENFTSTSAIGDLELATSSLTLSTTLEEVEELEEEGGGEGSRWLAAKFVVGER